MKELISIDAQNFVTYKEATLDLSNISDSLIFIDGENKDSPSMGSNGAGKTLLFDMITWCLYGETVRGIKADEVIGPFGKKTQVGLVFRDGNENIEINRIRVKGKTTLEFCINGADQGGQDSVDRYLMDWRSFRNSVIMGQDDVARFAAMTDANKKSLISSMIGIDIFDIARIKVKQKRDLVTLRIDDLDRDIVLRENNLSNIRKEIDELVKDAHVKKMVIDKNIEENLQTIAKTNADKKAITTKLERIPILEIKLQRVKETWNNYHHENMARIDKIIEEAEEAMAKFAVYSDKMKRVLGIMESATLAYWNADNRLIGKKCKYCGVTMMKENLPLLLEEQRKIVIENVGVYLQSRFKVRKYKGIMREKQKIRDIERADLKDIEAKAFTEIHELQSKIDSLNSESKRLNALQMLITSAESAVKALTRERNSYNVIILSKKKSAKDIKAKIAILSREKNKILQELEEYNFLYDAFGPRGIPAYTMEEVADSMNQKISSVMDYIVDGDIQVEFTTSKQRKKKLTTEFDILITDITKNNSAVRFPLWSGGEKERISFAIVMAFKHIVSSKLDLLLIDEALDKNISAIGVDKIIDYIHTLDSRIFVISHRKDVRSKFNTVVQVAKQNGRSKLSLL